MTTPFARPSGPGDKFDNHDHLGRLLIIYPKHYDPSVTTSKGVNACADADIIVVDSVGPDGRPLVFHDAKIFGNLAKSVRDSVGSKVLGRLAQVPTAGGNLAWVLNDWTDAEAAQAAPADQAYAAGQFAKPAQNQAPPPQQQYGNPPPQAPGHDPWAGVNAAPAPPPQQQYAPPAQAQYAPPPGQQQFGAPPPAQPAYGAAPPAAAAPAGPEDPTVAFLISKGLPEAQVRAMDPGTRQSVAATYG